MYRKGHSIHRVWYHPWFLESTRGPEEHRPWIWGRHWLWSWPCTVAPSLPPWLPPSHRGPSHRGSLTRQGNSRKTSAAASGVEVADARVLFPWGGTGRTVSGDIFGSHGQGRMLPGSRG